MKSVVYAGMARDPVSDVPSILIKRISFSLDIQYL